jgi:hypothetical protein
MKAIGLVAMGVVLAGCSGGLDAVPGDLCKKQHVEQRSEGEVAVCDELYDQAPYVHLPKDESDRAFAGIAQNRFVTASGKTYGVSGLDTEAKRHATALYELKLDGDTVTEHRPVLELGESVFVAPFLGRVAEGTISRRTGATQYAFDASLPVRVEFAAEPAAASLSGGPESSLTIANLDHAVTASDGSCLPALTSYGDEATFAAGTSVELHGYRVPSMHVPGDDEFVFLYVVNGEQAGSLMSPSWYRGPLDLAQGAAGPSGHYSGVGHGTPGYIPTLELDFVDGGGQPCTN